MDPNNPLAPYRPPNAPVTAEDERALAIAEERGRRPLFAVLFVLFITVPVVFPGGWLGWVLAPTFGGALWLLYSKTMRRGQITRPARTAGTSACPACGSRQTDEVDALDPSGALGREWRCFACEHRWR